MDFHCEPCNNTAYLRQSVFSVIQVPRKRRTRIKREEREFTKTAVTCINIIATPILREEELIVAQNQTPAEVCLYL
jgi:hypothetical protein